MSQVTMYILTVALQKKMSQVTINVHINCSLAERVVHVTVGSNICGRNIVHYEFDHKEVKIVRDIQ